MSGHSIQNHDAFLPDSDQIPGLLDLSTSASGVARRIHQSLILPVADYLDRPGKRFRARLLELGSELGATPCTPNAYVLAGQIIEAVHTGALIIDDIQDQSKQRRGQPTLHLKYGTPLALNAGNWLYFWPLTQLSKLGLDEHQELIAHRICMDVLGKAHFGQALDVGTRIDEVPQDEVAATCLASMELKTGVLMSLALRLGALLSGATATQLEQLDGFGRQLGIALQMFDDIGNFVKPDQKRFEDLYLRRPTWIWGFAAEHYSSEDYQRLVHAIHCLPDESFLKPWIKITDFVDAAKANASTYLHSVFRDAEPLFGTLKPESLTKLRALALDLERAYV